MRARKNVNTKLRNLCFEAGFDDIAGLARHIKRHRVTVHRAWKNPGRYGPTHKLIKEALKNGVPVPHGVQEVAA